MFWPLTSGFIRLLAAIFMYRSKSYLRRLWQQPPSLQDFYEIANSDYRLQGDSPFLDGFQATLHSVIDGDTVKMVVDFSRAPFLEIICRLKDVMAPELGSKAKPNLPGWRAKGEVKSWFEARRDQQLISHFQGRDKYGRSLVVIVDQNGQSLNDHLIMKGLATAYNPRKGKSL